MEYRILQAKYEHWRQHAVDQTEEQFSDGTLRLIGLFWSLLDSRGPLLMEEPELSLHEGVVQHLPQLIYRAMRMNRKGLDQVLISTHNTTLLMDAGIGPEEMAVFQPEKEDTSVELANDKPHIYALMAEGNLSRQRDDPVHRSQRRPSTRFRARLRASVYVTIVPEGGTRRVCFEAYYRTYPAEF